MKRLPSKFARRHSTGFTLLELLVTLVVLGFITTILGQAMNQFFRIDRTLATSALPAQAEAVRVEWIRQALAALQPPSIAGRNALRGTQRQLTGISGNPLANGPAGFGLIDLRVEFDANAGESALLAQIPGESQPIALLRWSGSEGGFAYFDDGGNRFDSWPPLAKHDPLPAVIVLETGLDSASAIVGALLISSEEHPPRLDLEQL